jgi:hypothetical protein
MKKLISIFIVAASLITAGAGCRTQARVSTPHHSVGVGAGVH